MIFPFGDVPEEVQQMMIKQRDLAHMHVEQQQSQMMDLMRGMDRETIALFKDLFHVCAQDAQWGSYYEGLFASILVTRFEYCPTCGGEHQIHPAEGFPGYGADFEPIEDAPFDQQGFDPEAVAQMERSERKDNMELYRMESFFDESDIAGIRCHDCKMPYISLTDRMIKAPDDCPGCFDKAAHG